MANVNTILSAKNLLDQAQSVIEKRMSRITKGDMTSSDLSTGGGKLVPGQSEKFVQMLQMKPFLLRVVRMILMQAPNQRIDRIKFASRILHAASEATALSSSNRSEPTTSKVELDAKLFKAETRISYEALQDNIEGGIRVRGNSFENMVFNLIAGTVARDIEDYALNSDTSHATTDYTQFNGWLKLADNSHSYDHSGAALSKAMFKSAYKELPEAYRQYKKEMVWVVGSDTELEWNDELVDAAYTEFAQSVAWAQHEVRHAYGIPLLVAESMPESSGTSSNLGKALLSHPKNMILGIWRNIFMEVDRDVSAGQIIVVTSVRFDARYEQVEGAVCLKNFKVS